MYFLWRIGRCISYSDLAFIFMGILSTDFLWVFLFSLRISYGKVILYTYVRSYQKINESEGKEFVILSNTRNFLKIYSNNLYSLPIFWEKCFQNYFPTLQVSLFREMGKIWISYIVLSLFVLSSQKVPDNRKINLIKIKYRQNFLLKLGSKEK